MEEKYCVALALLVLVFVFMNNRVEGYAELSESFPDKVQADVKIQDEALKQEMEKPKQQYVPIGLKPQKLKMKAPPSMVGSYGMLEAAPANMESYMLLPDEKEMVGVRTVDSRVPMAYPRVGGVGNIGKDMAAPVAGEAPVADKAVEPKGKVSVDIVYAPWCGWSKKSLPDFEKMNDKLNKLSPGQTNGWDVSCNLYNSETPDGKNKAKELNVKGFPSVLVHVNGEKKEGPRVYDEMIKLINNITGANIQA